MTDPLAPREVPLLTPHLLGTSGAVRVSEQDFGVEGAWERVGVVDHIVAIGLIGEPG